jgi:hypothetical protein
MVTVVIVITAFLYWRCAAHTAVIVYFVKLTFKSMQVRTEKFKFGVRVGLTLRLY